MATNNLSALLRLNPAEGDLYRQIFSALRTAILRQELTCGEQLPTTRALSQQLGISRNTVVTAYDMLKAEGYIDARMGSGFYVAADLPDIQPITQPHQETTHYGDSIGVTSSNALDALSVRGQRLATATRRVPAPPRTAFSVGLPDLSVFPNKQWSQCLQQHSQLRDQSLLRYQDQGGLRALQTALVSYLRLSRGVNCTAEQIIIVNGSQAGLDLIARLLTDPGDSVAVEEPGYLGARDAFLGAGSRLQPIAVDEQGLNTDSLAHYLQRGETIKVVYTTPSDQYPLGMTMSLPRRLTLLNLAAQHRFWVIEDDYDSEYRYHERPISSLQGMDQQSRVIYLGTFSKVMFPGLRVGYLVVPPALVDACRYALRKTGQDTPLLWQAALATFIESGYFATHIRRMRKLYGEKQRQITALLQTHLAEWLDVSPTSAGMQCACWFRHPVDLPRMLALAEEAGLWLSPLSRCYLAPPEQDGLHLGYAGIALADIPTAMMCLSKVLQRLD